MLRRFLYLDEQALQGYLSAVEGGLSDNSRQRHGRRGQRGLEGGAKYGPIGMKAARHREHVAEDERTVRETPESRFDRLLKALEQHPDEFAFEEVLDLREAFDRLAVGVMITVDCELEIPSTVRLLGDPEGVDAAFGALEAARPLAELMGEDLEGLPDEQHLKATREFLGGIRSDPVVVGEQEADAPKIAGKLDRQWLRDQPEGEARVVGKVARRWSEGESHSLVALPGASLLTREQRRSRKPDVEAGDDVMHGPALTLDILAIYR